MIFKNNLIHENQMINHTFVLCLTEMITVRFEFTWYEHNGSKLKKEGGVIYGDQYELIIRLPVQRLLRWRLRQPIFTLLIVYHQITIYMIYNHYLVRFFRQLVKVIEYSGYIVVSLWIRRWIIVLIQFTQPLFIVLDEL